MGSGKTAQLIRLAKEFKHQGFKVVVWLPEQCKTRKPFYPKTSPDELQSRDGSFIQIDYYISPQENLTELFKSDANVFMIDEANKLTNVQVKQLRAQSDGVLIYTFGLRCDYLMNMYEASKELLLLSCEIIILNNVGCCKCGSKNTVVDALLSTNFIRGNPDLINGSYAPTCFNCF